MPTLEIGSPIEELAKNIGEKYTLDYLINKHTILPYYIPFLPSQRCEEIIYEIKNKDCSGIYNKIGITAGSVCRKKGIYNHQWCRLDAKYLSSLIDFRYFKFEHRRNDMNKFTTSFLDYNLALWKN